MGLCVEADLPGRVPRSAVCPSWAQCSRASTWEESGAQRLPGGGTKPSLHRSGVALSVEDTHEMCPVVLIQVPGGRAACVCVCV